MSLPLPQSLATAALEGASAGPDLTGYLLVCVGLIGGIVALAYGFRRLFGNALRDRSSKRSIAVIDMLPLGGRRKVAVIRCYDRTFALGLGDKEVQLIAELDLDDTPKEVVERFPAQADSFRGELEVAEPVPPMPARAAATDAAEPRRTADSPSRQRVRPTPTAEPVGALERAALLQRDAVANVSDEEIVARVRREGVLG